MSIVTQRRPANSLRIAIWSGFLIAVFLPVVLERGGHPYYGAVLLRPGALLLGMFGPKVASARGITLISFVLYTAVIYAVLQLLVRRRQQP